MVRVAVLLRHLSNRQRVKLFRWVQVAGLAALFCLIHFTQLDLALRLWLSEDDVRDQVRFVQTVVRVHPNDYNGRLQKVPEYGWSALFRLRYYEATPDGKVVWFATVEGEPVYLGPDGFVSGIAFCELPEPPERSEMVYGHLYGPWWWWVEDF